MLKSIYLGFRKVKVQRVTVVEFGMYNRGGDGVGDFYANVCIIIIVNGTVCVFVSVLWLDWVESIS